MSRSSSAGAGHITAVERAVVLLLLGSLATPAIAQTACPRGNLPAYAHNDYLNLRPLSDALALGYRGVEADVFLVSGKLRLGHERLDAMRGAQLETTYLAPLSGLVSQCDPLIADKTPFLLTIELKTRSREAFDSLVAAIARYPELSRSDKISIVMVGWYPSVDRLESAGFHSQVVITGRSSSKAPDHAALASLDYGKTVGRAWRTSKGTRYWLDRIRAQRQDNPRIVIRAHNVPVNANVYRDLLSAGVDIIGTKDLEKTKVVLAASVTSSI